MPLEAKISPETTGIQSAPVQTVQGTVSVQPGSSIALNVEPASVAGYSRDGADIVVHLKSGEALRITDFYLDPTRVSHLMLVQDGQMVAADVGEIAGSGLGVADYVPMDALAGFEAPAVAQAAGAVGAAEAGGIAGGGMAAGGIGMGTLLPLAALGGGGLLAAAAAGGGGREEAPPPPPDTSAPTAATSLAISATGDRLTGRAEAGATVLVDTDRNGTANYSATVGADGTFSVVLSPPLANGETVSITVRDAAGNLGPAASVIAPDITPPAPASAIAFTADGTSLSGRGEPGATAGVDIDGDGRVDVTARVGADGTFTVLFATPLDNGQNVRVIVTDPAGNASAPIPATAPDLTPPPGSAPTVDPSSGSLFTGTAASGVAVVLRDAQGATIGQATVQADGTWSFTPDVPVPNGTVITVVAVNAQGEPGPAASVTVDATPPAAPQIDPSNGTVISGSAEAGATVTLTDGGGNAIGQAVADASGRWTLTPGTPLPNDTVVNAQATDAAGNTGPMASAIIDAIAPDAPTLAPPNATTLSGTGEPGATVLLTDGAGSPIGQAVVDQNGNWTFTASPPLADGSTVVATTRDAAGNLSPPATSQVDAIAPDAPTVAPSRGDVLSGVAEAGSTVILTDAQGNVIGQVTANGGGTWSFTPGTPLPDGTVVTVVARDAAGNTSVPASTTTDSTAPLAPVIDLTNGTTITGTAEAGTLVTLVDGNSNPIGQTTADGTDAWSFTPASPLPDGTTITATAQDAAGNVSPSSSVTVDALAPPAPTIAATSGSVLTGIAEAGATVILTDGNGNPIGQALADSSGAWSFAPASPLPNGTVVNAVARDATGNTSPPASTTVDSLPPAAPTIDPSNGTFLTGTAEAGATVVLRDGNGNAIGVTSADSNGNWSFTPSAPLPDRSVVSALALDAAGNASPPASTTIDATAPLAPTIDATNGQALTGTAEAGALVTLTNGNGDPIGQATADGTGNWSFTPASPLPHGTVVNATATDAAGNTGPQVATTVDANAPGAPTIDPTNGSQVSGTAEAGALLLLTDGDGNAIGQVVVDGFGVWSFTPATPLPDGTIVNATARDAAGNVSAPASTTVDTTAPAAPTINPTNGSEVTGTAEPNSTVVLMDGTGNAFAAFSARATGAGRMAVFATNVPDLGLPIGEVVTDGNGNWIFFPLLPLPDGTVVIAVSVDAAGNVSGPVSTVVDGAPPLIPTIDPTDGLLLEGTAEAGAIVRLTDGFGNLIGEATADGNGNWSFTPTVGIPHGIEVNAVAIDAGGNESPPASVTIDGIAPAIPVIAASNGALLTGTAESGALVILTDGLGIPIGVATTDSSGHWTFTPATPLPNGLIVHAVAQDASGNTSNSTSVTIDSIAPASPVLSLSPDGALLTGIAEPNSHVLIVVSGDTGNPILVPVNAGGAFTLPLSPPLTGSESISGITIDAAGNQSAPATIIAPDIAAPNIAVPESTDGWVNGAEAGNGVQVEVALRPTMQVGQVITASLTGQGGYQAQVTHVLSATDIAAGILLLSIVPSGGSGPFPDGAASVTASVGAGAASTPVSFVIDTTPPPAPVLSLLASTLTISSEPGAELLVSVNVGGTIATTAVTADNNGLASLNLLTDLDLRLDWAQLLEGQVSVSGTDPAGNQSTVTSLAIGPSVETPVTIGGFGLAVSLNPLNPQFGVTGTTEPNSTVVVQVVTPLLNVHLLPITADNSGHFTLNLLSPTVLSQLGLSVTDILNLGSQLSLGFVATDPQGHQSAFYGLALNQAGLSLNIGQIDVNGTLADDVLSGASGAEHINGNSGNDLITNIGTGDHVLAGSGNDTMEIVATNFSTIDGGAGFDTLLLANGIDLDYGPGVGTIANIERVDLGSGDSGSVLTLTAAEVDAITDAGNTLQITGEANDVLRIVGAVNTGTTQTHDGLVYDVYTFGANTVLVEDNTVQVVV